MAKQVIDIGTAPDDDNGDSIRNAFDKCNDNFTELYSEDVSLGNRVTALEGAPPGSVASLDDVGDVNAPTPANGDVLTWDSTPGEWVPAAPTGGSNALDDLTDVDAPTPSDGDVLTFDSGSGDWVPAAPSGSSGTAYEAGPVTAATTADLATWHNQGTSTVSDGTGALILKPQVDGLIHAREKTAPATPYDIYMRAGLDFLSTAAVTTAVSGVAGIMLRDNSDGEILVCGIYTERVAGDEQTLHGAILQRWTDFDSFSATPLLKYNDKPWQWVRINNNGTTITLYVSQDGMNWIQVGAETISTFVDTIDRIGVLGIASANMTEAVVSVPYFSTTAPA